MRDERQAFVDDGVKIDRLLVELTTAKHGPMAIDDLRRVNARVRISDRISPIVSDVARWALTIICSASALCMIALSG